MWHPLIVAPERRQAITKIIVDIVDGIRAWRAGHPTTRDDDADYAMLRAYTASDDTVPDPEDESERALADAIAKLADCDALALYGGAARVAFTASHLSAGEDTTRVCETIERALLDTIAQPSEDYDLIGGLA